MRVRLRTSIVIVILLAAAALPASGNGVTSVGDTLQVVKEDGQPSNVDIAVALSQATPLTPERVLIGRDDAFADSMAAGVLQGDSPLLLVPPGGPVPPQVMAELARLGPGRVTLLGGEAAVSPAVEQQLDDAGYMTDRRAGSSRFETALAVADEVADPQTVILARAFAAEGAPGSQAFADSLAAGALAAENRWPIVLTATDGLPAPTATWLAERRPQTVLVLGGTAAISAAVEQQVTDLGITTRRVAGGSRFDTALEVAKESGVDSAADVDRVTLVEAATEDAWAGGFAAAAHAAFFDAPIVLAAGAELPPATEAFLSGGTRQVRGATVPIRLTCVVDAAACEHGRVALGLPPAVPVTVDPPTGAALTSGTTVTVATDGEPATVTGGSCLDAGATGALPTDGQLTITAEEGTTCDVTLTLELPGGVAQVETATYTVLGPVTPLAVDPSGTAREAFDPDISADGSVVAFRARGDLRVAGDAAPTAHVWVWEAGAVTPIDVRPDGTLGTDHAYDPQITPNGRFITFDSRDNALDSGGRTGTTEPFQHSAYLHDRTTGTTTLVGLGPDGQPLAHARLAAASDDGQIVAYMGQVPGTDEVGNRLFSVLTASPGQPGRQVTGADGQPWTTPLTTASVRVSGDGSTVVFATADPDLVPGDTNAAPNASVMADVFALDVASGVVTRVSVPGPGQQAEQGSRDYVGSLDVSADGRYVAFVSDAANMLRATGDGARRMYVHDRTTGQTRQVDLADTGQSLAGQDGVSGVFNPAMSPDGTLAGLQVSDDSGCGTHVIDLAAGDAARTLFAPSTDGCSGAGVSVADTGAVALQVAPDRIPGATGDDHTAALLLP